MTDSAVAAERLLGCDDCGATFAFTANEQAFYRERGLREPTWCASCRAQRRAERNASLIADLVSRADGVPVVTDHGTFGGSGSGAAATAATRFSRGGTGGPSTPNQSYPATCAACGAATRVPFLPRGGRPVYCRACFAQRRAR